MKLLLFLKIYFATQINVLIYSLKRLPIVSKLLPNKLYGNYKIKSCISWLGIVFDIVKRVLSSNLTIIVFVYYAPRILVRAQDLTASTYFWLYLINFGLYSFISGSRMFRSSNEDQMFIHHFMVDPAYYYKYKSFKEVILLGMVSFPALLFVFSSVKTALILTLFKVCVIMFTDTFYLICFKKFGKVLHTRIRQWCSLILLVLAYAGCYFGIYEKLGFTEVMLNVIMWASIVLIAFSVCYELTYRLYGKMAIKYAEKSLISVSVSLGGESSVNDGATVVNSITSEEAKKYFEKNKHKPLTKYLDDTFDIRFKKALSHPIINDLFVHGFIFVILGLVIRMGWVNVSAENIFSFSPILVTFTLACSYSSMYSQMYFRNIDLFIMMGHLSTKEYVRDTMRSRYLKTLRRDIVVLICLMADMALFFLASGIRLGMKEYLMLFLICPPVLILQETYEWIVYYYVQPYARDLTAKSPVFTVLGYVNSLLGLVFLFIRNNITVALPWIYLGTAGVIALYFVLSNHAHKFFKLKL